MPLTPGTKVGPYEITALIGKGGMGEVYRAHDPRLNRDVAIKVSAKQFTERFGREARAIAALNHPNICTLYDVGPNYLVMELIEGEPLLTKEKPGPLPVDDVLKVAHQITDALEAAHEKGITHRDLKPGNIKVRPDGTVKVLDFGLAKLATATGVASGDPELSPTISLGMTEAGMVLGSAAYMAPEQARGQTDVDKRADIWAFGVVLYELLTGRRLFEGATVSDVLAAVLVKEPDLSLAPIEFRRLLKRCLEKDSRKRLRDIGDVWELMDHPDRNGEGRGDTARASAALRSRLTQIVWPSAAAVAILGLAAVSFLHFREAPPASPSPVRFQLSPPDGVNFGDYLALSPDGRQLAFTGVGSDGRVRLYVRPLDSLDAHVLSGTENAASPQWSPDGKFLAYGDGGRLKKIDAAGGPPQTLCEVQGLVGKGSWNRDDVIIFANRAANPGVWKVPAAGGTPVFVTKTNPKRNETFHAFPTFLPDGKHFLYLVNSSEAAIGGVYVGSLDAKPEEQSTERLVATQFSPSYAHSTDPAKTRLLFLRERTLMAQPFDPVRLKLTGDPAPATEPQIGVFGSYAYFTASENGALVYRGGAGGLSRYVWYDRQGKNVGRAGEPGDYGSVALSPDGLRAAVQSNRDRNVDVWLLDLSRDAATRLTFDPAAELTPIWSPDGRYVYYLNARTAEIQQKQSNGVGEEQAVIKTDNPPVPLDISRDGKFLLYSLTGNAATLDLWTLPLAGDRKPEPFLVTNRMENQARFSPDGRWVVYASDESGRSEIYVQPFPPTRDGGGKWMISNGGGVQPLWRRDGREIFYLGPNGEAMAADVETGATFKPGIPKPLFIAPVFGGAGGVGTRTSRWAVSSDGQRFLIESSLGATNSAPVTVVLNWQTTLK
jgi:Tol biopolymer transport system component/predicted Ser/Thr protein kinase